MSPINGPTYATTLSILYPGRAPQRLTVRASKGPSHQARHDALKLARAIYPDATRIDAGPTHLELPPTT